MTYVQIVDLIFWITSSLLGLMMLHFLFFSIVGIFARKKFPKAKVQHKYGLIIPARNEEAVVGNLIKSIYKNDYPQELLQVFVIAHNCSDKTAEICRELGATVYEYNNPQENTMGYAFRYLFDCINRDYGTQNYDGFFLFNADNILSRDYFEKMNDAFEAGNCENVITSFRNSKNFGSNMISGMYGIYFMSGCRLESRGRTVCGCSTRVQGTGYVISSKLVKDGWPYVTLTEDWEFSADQVLQGRKIVYCDEAVFYDEQPTTTKVMLRQRLRWSKGHLLVCLTRCKALFKSLFSNKKPTDENGNPKKNNKFSKYDIFVNCLPICVISGLLTIVNMILLAIAPLVDATVIARDYFINWGITLGISAAVGYVVMVIQAVVIFILENKRIKNVSIIKRIGMALLWPIFLFLSFPLEFIAMCSKNIGWKTIPHTDTTNFEALNDPVSDKPLLPENASATEQEAAASIDIEVEAESETDGESIIDPEFSAIITRTVSQDEDEPSQHETEKTDESVA